MATVNGAPAVALAASEGTAIWYLNNRMTVKATAASTGGSYSLVEALLPPATSPPLHIHHAEDEPLWVLEGELNVRCGDETFSCVAGSYAFLPKGVPHTFVVEGNSPARVLFLFLPAGGEQYFVEAGRPAEGDGLPAPGPIDFELVERVGAKFQIEIVGPPIAPRETP